MNISIRTVFIFLSLASLFVYMPSFNAPFLYDDFYYLKDNPNIRSLGAFWSWLSEDYSKLFTGRPFLLFTFFLNYKTGGLDVFGYHLFNLLLHITNGFLVYLIFSRYADADKEKGYSSKYILGAVLFLIHPINTESVTYISSRSSVLFAFFVLLSMLCFFGATENRFHLWYYISSVIFFIFGLLSKEVTVLLPVLLVSFDYFFMSKNFKNFLSRIKYHIPYFVVIISLGFIYVGYITTPLSPAERPWLTHIFTEIRVFTEYLRLFIIPVGLNIDHDVKPSSFIDSRVVLSSVLMLVLLFASIRLKRKQHIVSFSILWFFINMSPFLVIRLNDFMAERWVYLASIGFSIGFSEIMFSVVRNFRMAGIVIAAPVVFLFGALTIYRNHIYTNPVLLWQDTVKKSPDKARPYLNLSEAYIRIGDMTKALENIQESVKRGGAVKEAYMNLAAVYEAKGDYRAAERVLKVVEKSAFSDPAYYQRLGSIYMKMKEYEKALIAFEAASDLNPDSPANFFSIGECYDNLSRPERAKEYFMRATKAFPETELDYLGQGLSFLKLGEPYKAIESFEKAVKIDPLSINIRNCLADVLFGSGRHEDALKQYSEVVKMAPENIHAYRGIGIVMLAKGNLKEAEKYFNKALSLLPSGSPQWKELQELLDKTRQ